jgi:hypothetical protein
MDGRLSQELIDAFWALVDRSGGDDACWPWTGPLGGTGIYGRFSIPGLSSNVVAHRLSYELTHGRQPLGTMIWRRCRNASCVNPRHLEAGDRDAFTRFQHGG